MAFALHCTIGFFITFGGFVNVRAPVLTSEAVSCSTERTQTKSTIRCDFQLLISYQSKFDFIVIYRCLNNKEYVILQFQCGKTFEFDARKCDIIEPGFKKKKINGTYIELEVSTQIDGTVFWDTAPSVVGHKNCLNITDEGQTTILTAAKMPSSASDFNGEVQTIQSASLTTTEPPNSIPLDGSQIAGIVSGGVLGIVLGIALVYVCCQSLYKKASHAPGIVSISYRQTNANGSDPSVSNGPHETSLLIEGNTVDGAGMERNVSPLVCSSESTTDTDLESFNLDVSPQNPVIDRTDLAGAVSADGTETADQLKISPACSKTVLDIVELPAPVIESAGVPTQETAGALPNCDPLVSGKENVLVLPEDQRKRRGNKRRYLSLPQDRSDGKMKEVSYVDPENVCFTLTD